MFLFLSSGISCLSVGLGALSESDVEPGIRVRGPSLCNLNPGVSWVLQDEKPSQQHLACLELTDW